MRMDQLIGSRGKPFFHDIVLEPFARLALKSSAQIGRTEPNVPREHGQGKVIRQVLGDVLFHALNFWDFLLPGG